MIKQVLENAIRTLESEKAQRVSQVNQKATIEKIAPYNREIDQAREKAISELATELNSKITQLQEEFAKNKQVLIEKGEQKKADFAKTTIATETSLIEIEYESAIKSLRNQIEKIGE